jgi:hypothetical protein
MKRNHCRSIKFDDDEIKQIEKKAKALGVSFSAYIRMVVLNSEVKIDRD